MKREGRTMSPVGLELLQSNYTQFLKSWKLFGGHCYYKHHMGFHLVQQANTVDNPRLAHTYPDETANRFMGFLAKSLHGGKGFYQTFLMKAAPQAF